MSTIPSTPPPGIPARSPSQLLTLEEAAAFFRANNAKGHASTATLLRWIVSGKRKVKLKAVRKHGEWFTTESNVRRFRDATGL